MHRDCLPEKSWKVLRSLKSMLKKYHAVLAGATALALLDLDMAVKGYR